MLSVTLGHLLAAAIGSALTLLGLFGQAVADRLRYPRLQAELAALRTAPMPHVVDRPRRVTRAPNTPPRKPQRRVDVRSRERDDVADWLGSMGFDRNIATEAARRARAQDPSAPLEVQIQAALKLCPEGN